MPSFLRALEKVPENSKTPKAQITNATSGIAPSSHE
jgi:hypothetical protein